MPEFPKLKPQKSQPQLETLDKICESTGKPMHYFFPELDTDEAAEPAEEIVLARTEQQKRLLTGYDKLSPDLQQYNFWQFRINKSRGRVIGALIEGVFYIVWLDCHHNLTDSEGYGKARKYPPPKL